MMLHLLTPDQRAELHHRLLAIYARVDAEVQRVSPRCDASGKCCRFREYGHTLFISHIEADYLLEHAPGYALPVSSDGCPFQKNNLCTTREPRPLGCRIYFCDPTWQQAGNELMESALQEVKQLAQQWNLGWQYAPLHFFLNAVENRNVEEMESQESMPQRVELPVIELK